MTATTALPAETPVRPESASFFSHHGIWAPGVRLFRRLRFASKALIISLAFVLPLLALLGWGLQHETTGAFQARKDALRGHAEIATGVLQAAYAQEQAGTLDRAAAQALALRTLATVRYHGEEYFWVNDMQPRMLMHPFKPEMAGKALAGVKDPNGKALFDEMVATVKQGGSGFVSYQWPRPGQQVAVDKLSYVKGFEPWGWIVGTGVYVDDLEAAARARVLAAGLITAASLLVAAYLFLSFYRVMDGGLRETRRHLRAMTAGDLTTSPSPWGQDEAAQLMLELRAMQQSLRQMVLGVRHSSSEIVHSSSEIASGAMDLSARTEQAAANLEQSAAAMEQIASTVSTASDTTAKAAEQARENARAADAGGRAMQEVQQTMGQIRTSSDRIAEIIGTIDGIAFQTNILALNAAVEAARAGEQGRGFAVVAGEVRTLAQRSATAAREIKSLIVRSVEQVERGTAVVRDAGEKMGEVLGSAQRVDALLAEIASGAREQSQGVGQVGQAVQDLDRMTQQNAALVEQTAAASSAMKDQAAQLAERVQQFKLPADATLQAGPAVAEPAVDEFDFDKAIDAHRAWKVKLRSAIAERGQLDAATICRDDQCPLGRWLHGPGGARWGSRPTFSELLGKHADFHRIAGNVAERINRGAMSEAERLIGAGSDFARVSTEVATLLTRAKRGL